MNNPLPNSSFSHLPLRESFLRRLLGRPETLVISAFATFIIFGTFLMMLPIFQSNKTLSLLDALFTVTSAICVTGLTVLDTGSDFTRAGQILIMFLIQLGGLGIMALAALAFFIGQNKLSLNSQALLGDTIFQCDKAQAIKRSLRSILRYTLAIELIGAALLFLFLPATDSISNRLFVAIFHAVSAFCNAGFSTFSSNLIALNSNFGFLLTISALIFLGGIGYPVLLELLTRFRNPASLPTYPVKLSLSSRIALSLSLILIIVGGLLLYFLGFGSSSSELSSLSIALFHSISARTAGFNLVDFADLPFAVLLILVILMFVGGSPSSCAGGVKTTTIAIWLAGIRSQLRRREDVTVLDRRISTELVRRVGTLLSMAVMFNLFGLLLLSVSEAHIPEMTFERLIFEQVSAFGTVGLSTGITASLSPLGKLWIILSMFVGRVGPITLGGFLVGRHVASIRYPKEHILIG